MKRALISSILIICLVFHCVNIYRVSVNANPIVVGEVAVEVGEAIYEVAPEAVALVAELLQLSGAKPKDLESAQKSTKAYLEYILKDCKTDEEVKAVLRKNGFDFTDNYSTISVNQDDLYTYVISPTMDISDSSYDVYQYTNSKVYEDKLNSAGEAVKSGVKVSYDVLVNNGALMYEWLHSGDFTLSTPMVADISSYEVIQQTFCDWQNSVLNVYFGSYISTPYAYEVGDSYNMQSYSSTSYTAYPYIDIYYGYYPENEYMSTVYKNLAGCILFAVVFHNADDSLYHISTRASYVFKDGSRSDFFYNSDTLMNDSSNANYNSTLSYAEALNKAISFGIRGVNFGVCVNDLSQAYHFVNTSTSSDTDDDFIGPILGDNILSNGDLELLLDTGVTTEGATVWDSPTALSTAVSEAGALSATDDVVITLPGIAEGTNELDYPEKAVAVLNPDLVDTSTEVPSSVTASDSILDWIKDFFKNFFDRLASCLRSLLMGLFSVSDTFLDNWFNIFQEAFEHRGYVFDFSFLGSAYEKSIQDIYITWNGTKILFMPASYIYGCVEVARPIIRAFIYFLILLHDRKRLIYLIRGRSLPEGYLSTDTE